MHRHAQNQKPKRLALFGRDPVGASQGLDVLEALAQDLVKARGGSLDDSTNRGDQTVKMREATRHGFSSLRNRQFWISRMPRKKPLVKRISRGLAEKKLKSDTLIRRRAGFKPPGNRRRASGMSDDDERLISCGRRAPAARSIVGRARPKRIGSAGIVRRRSTCRIRLGPVLQTSGASRGLSTRAAAATFPPSAPAALTRSGSPRSLDLRRPASRPPGRLSKGSTRRRPTRARFPKRARRA